MAIRVNRIITKPGIYDSGISPGKIDSTKHTTVLKTRSIGYTYMEQVLGDWAPCFLLPEIREKEKKKTK
jgi:hypothetical protein